MSKFSETLSDMMRKHQITAYGLSKSSGVDRTLIQKMLSGSRNPADRDKILSLAVGMQLTAHETEALLQARNITMLGERAYGQLMKVHELIVLFKKLENTAVSEMGAFATSPLPLSKYFEGSVAVNQAIKMVLDHAAATSSTEPQVIGVFGGVECSFLMDYLAVVLRGVHDVTVQHLIPFESLGETVKGDFNLEKVIGVLPTILSSDRYSPRYFYVGDRETTQFGALPHYILTGDGVLGFSHDFRRAVFLGDIELRGFFRSHFEQTYSTSASLLNSLDTPVKNMQYYADLRADLGKTVVTLTYQPCFTPVLDEWHYRKYVRPEVMAAIDSSTNVFANYMKVKETLYTVCEHIYSIFSLEGVRDFLDTGRLAEYPDAYYTAIRLEDRKQIISDLINLAEQTDAVQIHLLRDDRMYSRFLWLGAYSESTVTIVHNHPQRGYTAFSIEERNVSRAIHDYLVALRGSDYILSAEESLAEIKKLLSQY